MTSPVSPFAITAPAGSVALDPSRKATAAFNVSNALGRQVTARARVVCDNEAAAGWFSIAENMEVILQANQSYQYNVAIAVPPDALPGSYSFRIDVVGVENPDEMASQGPSVSVEVPPPLPAGGGGLPSWWWIPVVAVVVLLIGGVTAFLVLRGGDDEPVVITETPVPRPQIRQGATGEHVTYLQTRLRDLGYDLEVDGMFGPITTQRVRMFQQTKGLQVDGIVGPLTWAALEAPQ